MMTVDRLLSDLADAGIQLTAADGVLRFRPKASVTPELLGRIRTHKAELLSRIGHVIPSTVDTTHENPGENEVVSTSALEDSENARDTGDPSRFHWTDDDTPAPVPILSPPPPLSWEEAALELVEWFQANRARLPGRVFTLRQGVRVVNPATFYASVQADVDQGPAGLRARRGGLMSDLACLRAIKGSGT